MPKHPKLLAFLAVIIPGLIAAAWYGAEMMAAYSEYNAKAHEPVDLRDTLYPDYD